RLNGNLVREAPLRDGDLLQVGPFSFRVHLPANSLTGVVAPSTSRLEHMQRSRRNLAHLALRQRKLLRLQRACQPQTETKGDDSGEQLSKQASTLKARIRDYDQRARVLEDAERELSDDREALDKERAAFRAQVQQGEQDLAERLKDVEVEIQR